MELIKAYNITKTSYPNEVFNITPDPNYIDCNNYYELIITNVIKYQKQPTNDVLYFLPLFKQNTQNPTYASQIFSFNSINYKYASNFYLSNSANYAQYGIYIAQDLPTVTLNQLDPTNFFTFNSKNLKQNFYSAPEFNFLSIQPVSNTSNNNQYGYLLYPSRVCIEPTNLTYDNAYWYLTTKTSVIPWSAIYLFSNQIAIDALALNEQYLNNAPITKSINTLDNQNTYYLNYSLSSYRSISYNNPLAGDATFSAGTKQNYISGYLENDTVFINPDTLYIAYSATYNPNYSNAIIAQTPSDTNINKSLNVSYVTTTYPFWDGSTFPSPAQRQIFQLLQYRTNKSEILGDTQYSFLSADINLNSGVFQFFIDKTKAYFYPNSKTKISYDADAVNHKNTGESAISTLNSLINSGQNIINYINLNQPISANTVGDNDIIWKTKYPPHYYSYKVSLNDNNNKYYDSNKLNFHLVTDITDIYKTYGKSITSVKLKTYIKSDFNFYNYNLLDSNLTTIYPNETIKYEITKVPKTVTNDNNSSSLSAFVGSNSYDFLNPQWIPLSNNADKLTVIYNNGSYDTDIYIRASLSSNAGIMNVKEATLVSLSGYNISNQMLVNKVYENSNIITLDASINQSSASFPGVNLNGSYISWSVSPTLSYIDVYSVDSDYNVIQQITPNTLYPYSSSTWAVTVSGYGPNTTTITLSTTLSSQILDSTTSITTNPKLFNVLSIGKFDIIPSIKLDNLNQIRKINLDAKFNFHGTYYNLPSSLPIYWTWSYDGNNNPQTQPLTAYTVNNPSTAYQYGTTKYASLLSSLCVQIQPQTSQLQNLHTILINANCYSVYPPITGTYQLILDDFPSQQVLNCDFVSYYNKYPYPVYKIADTSNNKNTITRPYDDNSSNGLDLLFELNKKYSKTENISWIINNDNNHPLSASYDSPLNYLIIPIASNSITYSSISVLLSSSYAVGWTSAHNISATTNIYIIPNAAFYKPLEFINYPEYAWFPNSSTLTLLNSSNYTQFYFPSAYNNKISNSQSIWLSANKKYFNSYQYICLNDNKIYSLSSNYGLLDISYDPNTVRSLPLTLMAYNNTTYPPSMGTSFLSALSNNAGIIEANFNNFTSTVSSILLTDNNFKVATTIIPYNDATFTYTVDNTTLDLNKSGQIIVKQSFGTSPDNSPAIIVGGNINYYLSNEYWTVSTTVSAIPDTPLTIFTLQQGDPYVSLNTGDLGVDTLTLSAVPYLFQQIQSSTFPVGSTDYQGNTNLWNQITIS